MDPWIDEKPEIVSPGPIITSLLKQQPNHRSTDIWNGEVKYLVLATAIIFIDFARPGPTSVLWSLKGDGKHIDARQSGDRHYQVGGARRIV